MFAGLDLSPWMPHVIGVRCGEPHDMRFPRTAICLAAALAVAPTLPPAQTDPAEPRQERCYGVALAGENEGVDDRRAPGSSAVDYQGNAWIMVPIGECGRRALPVQTDGTPRRGAIQPVERDRPE